MSKDHNHDLERELTDLLSEGDAQKSEEERLEEGRRRLQHKYEIRIQMEHDPIVEETLKYRSFGKEIDHRYDEYLKKTGYSDKDPK